MWACSGAGIVTGLLAVPRRVDNLLDADTTRLNQSAFVHNKIILERYNECYARGFRSEEVGYVPYDRTE
jgi:hypothetical protein